MSTRPPRLRPHDVAVALQLILTPDPSYPALASCVGLSLGEGHNAVQRLRLARLVGSDGRQVSKRLLLDFIVHGVPYAFPGARGRMATGVPTGPSGPALLGTERGGPPPGPGSPSGGLEEAPVVWTSAAGHATGASLPPLCPAAPSFIDSNPPLYRWLTVVDALRLDPSRERHRVERLLRKEMHEGIESEV